MRPFGHLFSESVQSELLKSAVNLNFKRGEFIYRQGDKPRGIYFVQKGLIGLTLMGAESGKEHLVRFFKQGQFFGHRSLFSEENYHADAVSLEQTEVVMVPQAALNEVILRHPEILKAIVRVLSQELRRAETQHVMILENQILSRVAQAVVYLKELHPEHNWTRQEIANFCASTVSTVIKALAELETMGYIEQTGRQINILNKEALVALQGE